MFGEKKKKYDVVVVGGSVDDEHDYNNKWIQLVNTRKIISKKQDQKILVIRNNLSVIDF